MIEISQLETEEELEKVNQLNWEYLEWCAAQARDSLGEHIDINKYYKNSLNDQAAFLTESGRLLLAKEGGEIGGIICLKKIRDDVSEVKRLYVRPGFRGKKIGEKLISRLVEEARAIGYSKILLDSDPYMSSAHNLYKAMGFVETAPYSESEVDDEYAQHMIYMELVLR